jgi:hypothetical protein
MPQLLLATYIHSPQYTLQWISTPNQQSTEIATHMPTLNNLTQTTTRNISPAIHYIVGKTVYSSSSSSELSLECIKKVIYLNYTVKAFERGLAKRVNLLVTLSP